ncbi:MAG: hypothetical protein R3F62_28030 [Planctomycetota bacterium]
MTRFATTLLGALLLAGGLAAPAAAQGGDLQGKLDKKLAEGWIKDPAWITDYDEAKAKSSESGKLIFGYFTRSYSY